MSLLTLRILMKRINKKGNIIYRIGLHEHLNLYNDWVVFEDFWITEDDKLYDSNGNKLLVKDFKYIKENILLYPELAPHHNPWSMCKLSCVKFSIEDIKKLKKGDIIYSK